MSIKEYTKNKLWFDAWISKWSLKKLCVTNTMNRNKISRNRIKGAKNVLAHWVLYDTIEDYSYLITFVEDKINN